MRSATTLLCLALGLVACSRDDRPPIVYRGESLRFGTNEDPATLCGGTLSYLDGYAGYLRDRLGGPVEPVNFYWMPDDVERSEFCNVVGCTNARNVYSAIAPDEHELVHAIHYRDRVAFRPLEEGFAELFGDDADIRTPVSGDVEALLRLGGDVAVPPAGYPLAGHFVSFLATEYTDERLERLALESNLRDSYEQTSATFMNVYGVSLSSAVETYASSYPRCDHLQYRDNGFDCRQDAEAVDPSGTTVSATLDCADDAVLGPRYGERWTRRTIEVTQAGIYRFEATKSAGQRTGRVRVTGCGLGCLAKPAPTTITAAPGSPASGTLCLSAGLHVVRFAIAADDTGDMALTLQATGGSCP